MKKRIRIPWITLSLAMLAIVFHLLGGIAFDALAWRADWVETGEVWRVVTGHLVHLSGDHLVWDLGAFLVLGVFVERISRGRFFVLVGSVVLCSEFVLRFSGRFEVYCGLSGIDLGLFVLAAFQVLGEGRRRRDWLVMCIGMGALILAFGKVLWEVFLGSSIFVSDLGLGFSVAAEAHVAGVLAALFSSVSLTTYQLVGFKFRHVSRTST